MKRLMLLLMIVAFSNIACATGVKTKASVPAGEVFKWKDMGESREIYLEPGLVAVFSDGLTKPRTATLKSKSLGTLKMEREFGSVRLYRAETTVSTRALMVAELPGASPVFTDLPTPGGRRMALPGTILVQFRRERDEAFAAEWAKAFGMTMVRKQLFPQNSYVFLHKPGLPSLEMANQLSENSEVEHAQPDWWREVSRR